MKQTNALRRVPVHKQIRTHADGEWSVDVAHLDPVGFAHLESHAKEHPEPRAYINSDSVGGCRYFEWLAGGRLLLTSIYVFGLQPQIALVREEHLGPVLDLYGPKFQGGVLGVVTSSDICWHVVPDCRPAQPVLLRDHPLAAFVLDAVARCPGQVDHIDLGFDVCAELEASGLMIINYGSIYPGIPRSICNAMFGPVVVNELHRSEDRDLVIVKACGKHKQTLFWSPDVPHAELDAYQALRLQGHAPLQAAEILNLLNA